MQKEVAAISSLLFVNRGLMSPDIHAQLFGDEAAFTMPERKEHNARLAVGALSHTLNTYSSGGDMESKWWRAKSGADLRNGRLPEPSSLERKAAALTRADVQNINRLMDYLEKTFLPDDGKINSTRIYFNDEKEKKGFDR